MIRKPFVLWAMLFPPALHALGQDATDSRPQVITDSLADDFRSVVARDFSQYRTINMSWEMKAAHDYDFTADGKAVEKGQKRNLHTLRFSTMYNPQNEMFARFETKCCHRKTKRSQKHFF